MPFSPESGQIAHTRNPGSVGLLATAFVVLLFVAAIVLGHVPTIYAQSQCGNDPTCVPNVGPTTCQQYDPATGQWVPCGGSSDGGPSGGSSLGGLDSTELTGLAVAGVGGVFALGKIASSRGKPKPQPPVTPQPVVNVSKAVPMLDTQQTKNAADNWYWREETQARTLQEKEKWNRSFHKREDLDVKALEMAEKLGDVPIIGLIPVVGELMGGMVLETKLAKLGYELLWGEDYSMVDSREMAAPKSRADTANEILREVSEALSGKMIERSAKEMGETIETIQKGLSEGINLAWWKNPWGPDLSSIHWGH